MWVSHRATGKRTSFLNDMRSTVEKPKIPAELRVSSNICNYTSQYLYSFQLVFTCQCFLNLLREKQVVSNHHSKDKQQCSSPKAIVFVFLEKKNIKISINTNHYFSVLIPCYSQLIFVKTLLKHNCKSRVIEIKASILQSFDLPYFLMSF